MIEFCVRDDEKKLGCGERIFSFAFFSKSHSWSVRRTMSGILKRPVLCLFVFACTLLRESYIILDHSYQACSRVHMQKRQIECGPDRYFVMVSYYYIWHPSSMILNLVNRWKAERLMSAGFIIKHHLNELLF